MKPIANDIYHKNSDPNASAADYVRVVLHIMQGHVQASIHVRILGILVAMARYFLKNILG